MGYIGKSRSERSQAAIENGKVTYTQLKAWQKRAVDAGGVRACEWHHTGQYYKKTYYYDLQDFEQLNSKDYPKVQKEEIIKKTWYVLVSAEWGGTKRYPKIVGKEVVVKDSITQAQKYANKYYNYGGYIKEFDNEQEAREFAKTAELKK